MNPEEPEACNCGNHGCLEQMASATGLVRLAERYLASSEAESSLRKTKLSAKAVFDAYKVGDGAAAAIVEEFAGYLGRTMAVFACVTDPEIFVLGGGVSKAGEVLVQAVEKHYRKHAFLPAKIRPLCWPSWEMRPVSTGRPGWFWTRGKVSGRSVIKMQ